MELKGIEKKWRKRWEEAKIFEPSVDKKRKKFFVTAAFPYVQAPQHIGHARTYSVADIYARFKRMMGFNVLFPMAWHITGTPILAISRRIERGDKDLKEDYMGIFKVNKEDFESFRDPKNIVKYFSKEIKKGMQEIGFSIDWRREFTTGDATYNRFVIWQFQKLMRHGLIKKGSHPVLYCPMCQNPVGEHETLKDKRGEIDEAVAMKFEMDGKILPACTLRPETVYGATNVWVNPDIDYVEAKVDGETWIVSEKFSEKLRYQKESVDVVKRFKGRELVGKLVSIPMVNRKVIILPSSFVDPDNLSGIVYSVPAHAPFDWMALKEVKESDDIQEKFRLDKEAVRGIKPISLVSVEGFGEFPAIEICETYKIKSLSDERLEDVTKELYLKENSKGILNEKNGELSGLTVKEAKEKIKKLVVENKKGEIVYYLSNAPVFCRDGTECVVKIIKDQWFIDYSNKEWKEKAHKYVDEMKLLPGRTAIDYHNTIDWLHERACARRAGFGTRFPFDTEWIIEPLSDSTIYMAYYTIAHYLKGLEKKLDEHVFDYIFLDKGNADEVSKKSGIESNLLGKMKAEFEYWYPLDSRHSAKDLVSNHLTFFILNHLAIFPKKHWPKQTVVNGFVMYEGQKMSKSLRNIIPLRDAIEKYGADMIRTAVLATAGLEQSSDFSESIVSNLNNKVNVISDLIGSVGNSDEEIVKWMDSKVNRYTEYITNDMERIEFKEAINHIFFLLKDFEWLLKRSRGKKIPKRFIETIVKLIAPFMPHVTEEFWERMKNKGFVSVADWPAYDTRLINLRMEAGEDLIKSIINDVEEIKRLTKIEEPKKITIFVSPKWKIEVFEDALKGKELKEVVKKHKGKEKYAADYYNKLQKRKPLDEKFLNEGELKYLSDAKEFLENELGCEVEIISAEKIDHPKALIAEPEKPGLFVE